MTLSHIKNIKIKNNWIWKERKYTQDLIKYQKILRQNLTQINEVMELNTQIIRKLAKQKDNKNQEEIKRLVLEGESLVLYKLRLLEELDLLINIIKYSKESIKYQKEIIKQYNTLG